MAVGFQSPLTSANTNASLLSRTQDTDMVGKLDNLNTTDASSTATGAIHTTGGLGVEKKAYLNQVFVPSLSGDKALITSGLKEVTESVVTASELAELSGIASNVQDQIDLKANDSDVVHNTGAETIAGVKTFTNDTNLNGNVIVGGNLTVNGTTTTVNSATLDVTDTNITVNNGGNDASAEGAGLTVERTGTNGSFIYDSALASKFKTGPLGSESEVITASTTQTMTGAKTLSNLRVTGELSTLETIDTTSTGSNASVPTLNPTIRLKNASLVSINNFEDPSAGKIVYVTNSIGGTIDIIDNAGGIAARRILTGTGSNLELADKASIAISYNSDISRWMVIGGSGSGGGNPFQETPTGTVDGVNDTFTLSAAPTNADCLVVFVDGVAAYQSEYSLIGLNIVFSSGSIPALGQSVYAFCSSSGGGGGGGSITPVTQYITLNGTDITNKYVTLSGTPTTPTSVLLDLIGGSAQEYSVDFTMSGNQLEWNGLALDGFLSSGDKLRIHYYV